MPNVTLEQLNIIARRLTKIADEVADTAVGSSRFEMYRALSQEIKAVVKDVDALHRLA